MMYRVDSGTLSRRGFMLSAAAIAMARRTQVGRRAVAALAGLGESYDRTYNILAQDVLSYVNSPSGPYSVDQFKSAVASDVLSFCGQLKYFNQVNGQDQACPPDIQQQIDAAAASYANYLAGQAYKPPPSFAQSNYSNYGFSNPPGMQTNQAGQLEPIPVYVDPMAGGGGTTAYTVPPTNVTPTYTTTSVPTGGGQSTVIAATQVQVTFKNLSRPNQPLQPGDAWSLQISGPPNSLVTITASQNGRALGSTPFGSTDSSGNKLISGQMTANEIGSWSETILVGNGTPATINFSVVAAAAAPGPTGGGGGTQTGSTNTGATDTTPPPPPAAATNNNLLIYGGIAAAVAFFMFGGRR